MKESLSKFAHELVHDLFNISGRVKQLHGELDFNFCIETDAGKFILKIANLNEKRLNLELQNAVINHLAKSEAGLSCSRVCLSKN